MPGSSCLNLEGVRKVTIIGNGNVAMDVARILASPPQRLVSTDIDLEAFEALSKSEVKEIDVVGRRGPVQAAMTVKELRFLANVPGVSVRVLQDEFERGINENSIKEGQIASVPINQAQRAKRRLFDLMNSFPRTHSNDARVKVNLRFLLSPYTYEHPNIVFKETSLAGEPNKQVPVVGSRVESWESDLVIRSIGYKSEKIDEDLPFDSETGIVSNFGGKIEGNCFVAGWARTGPFGVVDTTMRSVFVRNI
jgi:adrenodoxin-NADP+ reductase